MSLLVSKNLLTFNGRGDWIRTNGLLHPMQARYQAAPHPDKARFLKVSQLLRPFNFDSYIIQERPFLLGVIMDDLQGSLASLSQRITTIMVRL